MWTTSEQKPRAPSVPRISSSDRTSAHTNGRAPAVPYAYPSRRFSAWMGIIVHSGQSVVFIGPFLALVLS
jgi:hypothetical protein